MHVIAAVEIPLHDDFQYCSDLLRAAYFASHSGPVALLVPVERREALDRELNPVVASNRRVHGVLYGESGDPWVWQAAGPHTIVIASSADARRRAEERGATCLGLGEGLVALEELGAKCLHAT
jgi:hypothetical protein